MKNPGPWSNLWGKKRLNTPESVCIIILSRKPTIKCGGGNKFLFNDVVILFFYSGSLSCVHVRCHMLAIIKPFYVHSESHFATDRSNLRCRSTFQLQGVSGWREINPPVPSEFLVKFSKSLRCHWKLGKDLHEIKTGGALASFKYQLLAVSTESAGCHLEKNKEEVKIFNQVN